VYLPCVSDVCITNTTPEYHKIMDNNPVNNLASWFWPYSCKSSQMPPPKKELLLILQNTHIYIYMYNSILRLRKFSAVILVVPKPNKPSDSRRLLSPYPVCHHFRQNPRKAYSRTHITVYMRKFPFFENTGFGFRISRSTIQQFDELRNVYFTMSRACKTKTENTLNAVPQTFRSHVVYEI